MMIPKHVYQRTPLRNGNYTMEEHDAEKDHAIKTLVLDLLAAGKTAVHIVWYVTKDPDSQYNSRYFVIDATVIDLPIDPA